MTTKRFLLDILEAKEDETRNEYEDALSTGDPMERCAARFTCEPKLAFIEKARRIVEKGLDEP